MPALRHLILDFDGTIFDTAPDIMDCVGRAMRKLGHTPTLELTTDLIGPPLPGLVDKILPGLDDAGRKRVIEAFIEFYDSSDYPLTRVYDDIPLLMEKAAKAGVGVSIATNKRMSPTLRILQRFPLGNFERIFAHDMEAGRILRKEELLTRILSELGLRPDEALMVGDTPGDIEAARAVGMPVAAVSYGYCEHAKLAALQPDHLFANVRELLALLPGG